MITFSFECFWKREDLLNVLLPSSLVELLVAIAIIAILASLLLPALSRARSNARTIQCQNNLRQLNIALHSYTTDYSAYPLFWHSQLAQSAGAIHRWTTDLSTYLSHGSSQPIAYDWFGPIYKCPDNPMHDKFLGISGSLALGSYGYNDRGTDPQPEGPQFLGLGGWTSSTEADSRYCKESRVVNPSDMIALGDAIFGLAYEDKNHTIVGAGDRLSLGEFTAIHSSFGTPKDVVLAADALAAARHRGSCNVGLADGHMEKIKGTILFATDPASKCRWNADNTAH